MTQIPVLSGPVPAGPVLTAAVPTDEAAAQGSGATRPGSAWAAAWAQSVPRAQGQDPSGPGARGATVLAGVMTVPPLAGANDPDAAAPAAGWPWSADPLRLDPLRPGTAPEAPATDEARPDLAEPSVTSGAEVVVPVTRVGDGGTGVAQALPVSDAAGQVPSAPLRTVGPGSGQAAPAGPDPSALAALAGKPAAAPGLGTSLAESRLQPADRGPGRGTAAVSPGVAGLPGATAPAAPGEATSGETVVSGAAELRALSGAATAGAVAGQVGSAVGSEGTRSGPADPVPRTLPGAADPADSGRTVAAEGVLRAGAERDLRASRSGADSALAVASPSVVSPSVVPPSVAGPAVPSPSVATPAAAVPPVAARAGLPAPRDATASAGGPTGEALARAAAGLSSAAPGPADAESARPVSGAWIAAAGLPAARTAGAADMVPGPSAGGMAPAAGMTPGGLSLSGAASDAGSGAAAVSASGWASGTAAASGLPAAPGSRYRAGAPVAPADVPAVATLAPVRGLATALPAPALRPADVAIPPESPRTLRMREARSADTPATGSPPVAAPAMLPPVVAVRGDPVSLTQARPVTASPEGLADPGLVRTDLPVAPLAPGHDAPGGGVAAVRHGTGGGDAPDPRAIAAQLGDAFVSALPDGAVEITLRPEELGRVRLVLSPDAGGMTVTLAAERPETLDQMRRAIDTLAADLRDLGYAGLNFRFDRSGHPGGRPSRPASDPATPAEIAPTTAADRAAAGMATGLPLRATARLDIRL